MQSLRLHAVLAFLAGALSVDSLAAQGPDALAVRPVRYFRTEQNQPVTRVRAFIQIPLAALDPAPGGLLSYQVTVKLTDGSGVVLHSDTWRNHAPAAARMPGAYGIDMIDFAVTPGKFTVDVDVIDSVSGRQLTNRGAVEGFGAAPEASDLLLASSMRVADANDTVPRPGEMRRGNTLLNAAANLRLTPLRTSAYYILEAYNGTSGETSGTMAVSISDPSGKVLFRTQPAPVRIASGGGLLKGSVNLEGLPPGPYELRVAVTLPGGSFERSAPLIMADLQQTLERDTARIAAERQTDEGFFRHMDIEGLDSAFAPLYYIGTPAELKPWKKEMNEDLKRRFLADFWSRRDPNQATVRNEAREQFYDAISFANRTYGERRVPGWKTDRGRVFAKYGAPDDVLRRLQEMPNSRPYEVWRYTRGKQRWFIFADRSGLQNFKLINSNDLSEVRVPDWREVIGEEAVRDIGRFLGVDFYTDQEIR